MLQGVGSSSDFLITGLSGASLFAITLLAIPYADRLRASEALVKQREIDLANLNELNQFIVQHLRESILVVDEFGIPGRQTHIGLGQHLRHVRQHGGEERPLQIQLLQHLEPAVGFGDPLLEGCTGAVPAGQHHP